MIGKTTHQDERGMAMVLALVVTVTFAVIATVMISGSLATTREYASVVERAQRLYLAEAGVSYAFLDFEGGGSGSLGSIEAPVEFGAGEICVKTTVDLDQRIWITSIGTVNGSSRAVRAMYQERMGVFHHAMFSGNKSADPTYTLGLAGSGDEADSVTGDIFSGGDVLVEGDATVGGTVRAHGTVTGVDGQEGVNQPIPDLNAMRYDTVHDVNVAKEFADSAVWGSKGSGDAWELPEELASHIFRLNPTDRGNEVKGTEKDDYFMEDPYESFTTSQTLDESAGTDITLSGVGDEPGADGNKKVYYIDGNLWLHSPKTYSFTMEHNSPDGVQVTFVVKGNIYFSDNLFLKNAEKDGMAFIALKDEKVSDSGNIYFGDPAFGTLLRMDAFMYAENDFYDYNLGGDQSKVVILNGTMSAGNHVSIERDYQDHHTRLELEFDDRLMTNTLDIPGIPSLGGDTKGPKHIEIASIEISMEEALAN